MKFLKKLFRRSEPIELAVIEVSPNALELLRLQYDNEALKRELNRLEADFQVRVGLEVRLCLSKLATENQRLAQENQQLRHQLELQKYAERTIYPLPPKL